MNVALHDLPRLDALDVYVGASLVAELRATGPTTEFRYRPDVNADLAVATTLPVTIDQPVLTPGRAVPPYFAGLLPEGRRLTALRGAIKTSADDDLSLLAAVGDQPVGRVRILPSGRAADIAAAPPTSDLDQLDFGEVFARSIGAAGFDPAALPGVQDKVSGRMITVPVTVGGADHLLKLDRPEFPHLVHNEAFFLRMARACGLATVDASVVVDRNQRPGLLVTRFDRVGTPDGIAALAVEDGCQVNNRYPSDKYSLSAETVITSLAEHCRARAVALRDGFAQVMFAIITGNGDQHAKNLSIVHTGTEWRLAPAYDIPSSQPYGDGSLAITIGDSREAHVSRRRALALASDIALPPSAADLVVDRLIARARPWLDRLDELPFDRGRVNDLRRVMNARIRLLAG